uniref:Uncharacterized protein n=1 Tax=Physcomitrium patens TaxID=3218 RepID=A0A2K1JLP5_PHYPA|nr:hypothetical protein PHYPA_017300 [Physcomitrium patens]
MLNPCHCNICRYSSMQVKMHHKYVICCSHSHNLTPKDNYTTFISAVVETKNLEIKL